MFNTIKSKFIILSLVVIILSIGIPVGFLIDQISRNFHDRSVLMIEATIDLLIDGLNDSMMRGDEKSVQKIVENISERTSIDHIRIFNELGSIRYSNDSSEVGKAIDIIEPGHLERQISEITDREVYLDRQTKAYKAIQPIEIQERCQTCHVSNKIVSYLDVDTHFTKAEIKFYTGSFHMIFLGAALFFTLALGFYFLFNKFINKPLNSFILALDAVESGNLELRMPSKGKDEFSKLNYHYNRMVNELKYSREKIEEMHFEQLQRADKMVTLGELTASMAHDINNHSAIIMSRADYLLYESERNEYLNKCNEDLVVINDQIGKISKITGRILKHSKKLSTEFRNFDLVKLVESSLDMIEPLIKKKKVYLKREIKLNTAVVFGDPNQFEQVILNLISNAVDAIGEGGDIVITVQRNDTDRVQLIVQDDGIGIDEESQEKIFSPFYSNKEVGKGTGLGLFIVQNVCTNHKAEIKCESKVNFGTTFTITFIGGVDND
jgi:signal transduction histidine kinase